MSLVHMLMLQVQTNIKVSVSHNKQCISMIILLGFKLFRSVKDSN